MTTLFLNPGKLFRLRTMQIAVSLATIFLFADIVYAEDAKHPAAPSAPISSPVLKIAPAKIEHVAINSMILSAALAGNRIVAVGERGIVLLSDDAGAS